MADESSLVLVVDDIEENLKVLSETLVQAGFHPLQAKSGERALQIAAKARPDLILLDIKMPGMDGFETIARLKADPDLADIPVIFISALNQIEDKVEGFRAGAVDYVSKPFQREEVVARVGTHLRLREAQRSVESEREKSERLLEALLPASIAAELKEKGASEPRSFPDASVLFGDLVNFTGQSSRMSPREVIAELNDITAAFDGIVRDHGCERIKTIGDAYLAVSGMPEANPDHALSLVSAARDMLGWLDARNTKAGLRWEMRVGVHSGEVVAGIVGVRRFIYDVFGDTVNVASRMENASAPMRINVSEATRKLLGARVDCEDRGRIEVKGQGPMGMYFVR
ncbi:MAG TPA: adenylate/guanylate cyclase domain-containing protein [Rectinemataceae bacterium]|nr:adenylate/guanylate cyclase domain-containing protein [Rectinemataceae bacterium]